MEKNLSMFFIFISTFISLVLPIGAALFLKLRFNASLRAAAVGMLIFIVFQPLTRLQLLQLLRSTNWFTYNLVANPWIIYVTLGVSAAVFENVGRFIGFKFLLRGRWQWKNGAAYGIGHGGIEAIIFAGIPFLNAIFTSFNNPGLLTQAPWMYLAGGIERLSAMTFHVAASLIVLYGIKNKKNKYLLYAILLHSILDTSIGFIKNIVLLEAWVAFVAISALTFIIVKIKRTKYEELLVQGGGKYEI